MEPTPLVGRTPPQPVGPPRRSRAYLIGFLPLALFAFFAILAPRFMEPMYANPPSFLGLPAGLAILVVAGAFMAIGILVMRAIPGCLGLAVGFWLFTVPSLLLVLVGPAIVIVVQQVEPVLVPAAWS